MKHPWKIHISCPKFTEVGPIETDEWQILQEAASRLRELARLQLLREGWVTDGGKWGKKLKSAKILEKSMKLWYEFMRFIDCQFDYMS